jgi:hypothetical protein
MAAAETILPRTETEWHKEVRETTAGKVHPWRWIFQFRIRNGYRAIPSPPGNFCLPDETE